MLKGFKAPPKTEAQLAASRMNAKRMSEKNLGRIQSFEERNKRSEIAKRLGYGKWMIGKQLSESHKQAISAGNKGRQHSKETREKIGAKKRDKPLYARRGEKHHAWKGGISRENDRIRKSLETRLWREAVLKRDNFICQMCGQRGGKLEADHIKPFSIYPELRFSIDNGRTLCKACHRKTDTWGGFSRRNVRRRILDVIEVV